MYLPTVPPLSSTQDDMASRYSASKRISCSGDRLSAIEVKPSMSEKSTVTCKRAI